MLLIVIRCQQSFLYLNSIKVKEKNIFITALYGKKLQLKFFRQSRLIKKEEGGEGSRIQRVGRWAVRALMCELALARSKNQYSAVFIYSFPFHVSFKFYVNLICLSYEKRSIYIEFFHAWEEGEKGTLVSTQETIEGLVIKVGEAAEKILLH